MGLDPSEPLAALFLRVLGSFYSDVEAMTRVLNLYRSVLQEDVRVQRWCRPRVQSRVFRLPRYRSPARSAEVIIDNRCAQLSKHGVPRYDVRPFRLAREFCGHHL